MDESKFDLNLLNRGYFLTTLVLFLIGGFALQLVGMSEVESKCGNGTFRQNEKDPSQNRIIRVQRIKQNKLKNPSCLSLDTERLEVIHISNKRNYLSCVTTSYDKRVKVSNILEIRQGYSTDGLQKAAVKGVLSKKIPEDHYFSIIYKHPKYVTKALDFVSNSTNEMERWLSMLQQMLPHRAARSSMTFDERHWILRNFRSANRDCNGEVAFSELMRLLGKLNLQMSEAYVRIHFEEIINKNGLRKEALDENDFLELFELLTNIPEFKNVLRIINGKGLDYLELDELQNFLKNEQNFTKLDRKEVESLIDFYEKGENKEKMLSVNGFRRLLQSRWGNIIKEGQDLIYMDMDQPLNNYFIKSSHNTYLTGIQLKGSASVEGYISALNMGSRLLELDIFDGDDGEPQITHKMSLVASLSLRNALKSIAQYAFKSNPYPVILTIENHVLNQQRVMADIFTNILGENLYIPAEDSSKCPLPSPNRLKLKFILRGKACNNSETKSATPDPLDTDIPPADSNRKLPVCPIDPYFGRLIGLPQVKLSSNIYSDIVEHPPSGSPSISERKVQALFESNSPLASYTATHVVKSYPSGLRQDSSNMSPIPSLLCGIQSVAMNFQTPGEELDLLNGLFSINGDIGYVLKPKGLIEGKDPRHDQIVKTTLEIAIICAQYLPKPELSTGVIDPYVSVEIFGVPSDSRKFRTKAVKNNGFNPVWKQSFSFPLTYPDLAILRTVVNDHDTTTSNDFIGEYSIPVASIRQGYSIVRLNTGFSHSLDEAASLFIRIAFS